MLPPNYYYKKIPRISQLIVYFLSASRCAHSSGCLNYAAGRCLDSTLELIFFVNCVNNKEQWKNIYGDKQKKIKPRNTKGFFPCVFRVFRGLS